MSRTRTHTYALMEVSRAAYDEIREKLLTAGYDHAVNDKDHHLNLDEIALTPVKERVGHEPV